MTNCHHETITRHTTSICCESDWLIYVASTDKLWGELGPDSSCGGSLAVSSTVRKPTVWEWDYRNDIIGMRVWESDYRNERLRMRLKYRNESIRMRLYKQEYGNENIHEGMKV